MSLSERTQQRLSNLIATISEGERTAEMLKQVLAEQKMFEPYTAYKRLDQSRIGQLSLDDIAEFLSDNKIIATNEEIHYLMRCLDKDNDAMITYPDFMNFVLPVENLKLRQIVSLRDSYYIDINMLLPYDVEWALARVFEQEIKNFNKMRATQELLTQSYDFSALECFKCLDKDFKGMVHMENINNFTKAYGNYLSTEELIGFFRVIDSDKDGVISYSEFLSCLGLISSSTNDINVPEVLKISSSLDKQLKQSRSVDNEIRKSRSRERELQQEILYEQNKRMALIQSDLMNTRMELQFKEDLKRSQLASKSREEWRRNREPPIYTNTLIKSRELEYYSDVQRSEERRSKERIDNLEQLMDSHQRQSKIDMELSRISALHKSRLYESDLKRSNERIQKFKESKAVQEELKRSRERMIHIDELRKSRERLGELQRDLENSRVKAIYQRQKEIKESRPDLFQESGTKITKSRIYETPKRKEQKQQEVKDSPMKGNEEHHLVMAMKEQITLHRELEEVKNQLSYKSDFHPAGAFDILDPNNRGQLTKLDFELAINDLRLYPSTDDIRLFYEKCCPQTLFLTYKGFLAAILPQSQQYQDLMLSRPSSAKMGTSTKALFTSLLKKYFQTENNAELLRQRLSRRPLFNISQAFQAVDQQNQGYVTNEQFKELFKVPTKYGVFTTNKDIDTLFNVYDKEKKGKITYKDFVNELSPKKTQI